MFGYVIANMEQLDEAQRRRYQQVYCGLCRALGQRHGALCRLTLTYDMTFLILLLSALDKTELAEEVRFRCLLHPLQRRTAFTNRHTLYAADMNLLLAYHQKLDDWEDEGKRSAKLTANALGGRTQGLEKRYPRQVQAINEGLAALKEMEKAYETNPDLPAAAFGSILGEVFVQDGHPLSEVLYAFGNQLGRFIYLMDAAVDLKKDIQQERYNPLITVPTERHQQLLELLMADCTRTFSALPILRDRELMENILYSGVWSRFPKRGQGEAQA